MALESSQGLPSLRITSSLVYPAPLPGVYHSESGPRFLYFMVFYQELIFFLEVSQQQGTHVLPQASSSQKSVGDAQRTQGHSCQLSPCSLTL